MDDATPPQDPETAAAPRRRRKALHVPLPAVVVGLGLASGAAVGQVPQVIARDDGYSVPAFTNVTLPVMANDTVNVFAFTFIYAFTPPAHGFANVLSGMQSLVYQGNPGFRGVDTLDYCIVAQGGGPQTNCATVTLFVGVNDAPPVPALGGIALAGLAGALGWLGMRGRRRR